jgi:hypothetical protein
MLANALLDHPGVQEIHLDKNAIGDAGVASLAGVRFIFLILSHSLFLEEESCRDAALYSFGTCTYTWILTV